MGKFFSVLLRSIVAVLSFVFLGLFIFPMFGTIINIGNISGAVLCIWLIILSIKPIHKSVKHIFCRHLFTKVVYRIINVVFTLFLVYGLVVTAGMVYCANIAPTENATAVVLGAEVKQSGPSVILRGRIKAAEKYMTENKNVYAVVTGGQGETEPMSEAQSMFNTMKDDKIDAKRIFMEDKATNTQENLEYSMKIIKDYQLNDNIAVVTDGFHQLRVQIIAYKLGIKTKVGAVSSDTSLKYLATFAVREWFAIPNQILFR